MGLKKLIEKLAGSENELPARLEDYMSIMVMLALMGDVLLQIITRYFFNNPLGWTEEIARYLLMILTFVGCPIAVRKNTNISLDFIYTKLPEIDKIVLSIFKSFVELFFYILGTVFSMQMCFFSQGRYLVTIKISKVILYGIVTAAFAVMAYRCLLRTFNLIFRLKEKPDSKEGGAKI